MDDDIYEVEQYPSSLFVTGLSELPEAEFFSFRANFICDGPGLSVGSAGSDEEKIGRWALAGQVEYYYIRAVSLFGNFSGRKSEIFVICFLFSCQFNLS